MRDAFRRQAADFFTAELALENEIGAPGKVERSLRLGFVHRQREPVTCDAALVAEGIASFQDVDRSWMIVHGESGPFVAMDSVGLNVILDIIDGEYEETGDEGLKKMGDLLRPYIQRGELGLKTGKGFYSYPDPEFRQPGFLQGE